MLTVHQADFYLKEATFRYITEQSAAVEAHARALLAPRFQSALETRTTYVTATAEPSYTHTKQVNRY